MRIFTANFSFFGPPSSSLTHHHHRRRHFFQSRMSQSIVRHCKAEGTPRRIGQRACASDSLTGPLRGGDHLPPLVTPRYEQISHSLFCITQIAQSAAAQCWFSNRDPVSVQQLWVQLRWKAGTSFFIGRLHASTTLCLSSKQCFEPWSSKQYCKMKKDAPAFQHDANQENCMLWK